MSCWPAILIAALAVIGGFGVLWDRHHQKNGPKGIGIRVIQFFAVFMLVPTTVILATTGHLETQTTGTLIGAVIGYVLSGIGKDE